MALGAASLTPPLPDLRQCQRSRRRATVADLWGPMDFFSFLFFQKLFAECLSSHGDFLLSARQTTLGEQMFAESLYV
jgi:hypothetical protein